MIAEEPSARNEDTDQNATAKDNLAACHIYWAKISAKSAISREKLNSNRCNF